jgi:hypothetical protein
MAEGKPTRAPARRPPGTTSSKKPEQVILPLAFLWLLVALVRNSITIANADAVSRALTKSR